MIAQESWADLVIAQKRMVESLDWTARSGLRQSTKKPRSDRQAREIGSPSVHMTIASKQRGAPSCAPLPLLAPSSPNCRNHRSIAQLALKRLRHRHLEKSQDLSSLHLHGAALAIASVRLPPLEASVAAVHCCVISLKTGFCLGQGFCGHAGRKFLTLRKNIHSAFDRFHHPGHAGAKSFPALGQLCFLCGRSAGNSPGPWT